MFQHVSTESSVSIFMCRPVSRAECVCHKCFVLIESCTSTCMCWFILRAARDLVMWAGFKGWESICMCWCSSRVVHDSACVDLHWELGVYLHASSHFESRVCNFVCVCVCVWKSWLLLRWMLCIWGFACRCGMHLCVPSAELVSSFVTMYWERGMYARCVYLHVPALSVYLHAWRAWHFSACDVPRAGRVSARVITFQTLCPYVIPVNVHAGEHRIEECLLVHKLHAYDYDGLDGVGDPLSLHVYGCALA